MNLSLTTKDVHGHTTEAMRKTVEERLSFLDKYIDDGVVVTISREGKGFDVTAQFEMNGKHFKLNSGVMSDAYEAIEQLSTRVKHKVKEQRNAYKTEYKLNKKIKQNNNLMESEINNKDEKNKHGIIERKKYVTKPMTEKCAIDEMEILGHSSFIFFNCEIDNKVCMLYAKNAGGYGIIELE